MVDQELPKIRELLFDNNYPEAQQLANRILPRKPAADNDYGMRYQALGDLYLDFDHAGKQLEEAVASKSNW